MDDSTTGADARPLTALHEVDGTLELERLADLFRSRASRREPVRQRDLPLLERTLRKHVAESLLTHLVPALVGELLDAVADDLSPRAEQEPLTQLEAQADAELRVVESVERCKAVLDAVGLEALARLRSTIESSELARFADLGRKRPAGWIDADELTAMEVCTATGLGAHDVRARLALATAPTPGAASLRGRLQRGAVSLYRACTIQSEIAALPLECGPDVVDATLRPKDGAPPSPALFRQRLTRACLAADREAADRRRRARCRRGAHAQIDRDGLGVLNLVNDADKVVAAMERVDAIARAARAAGDPRDLDSLRADIITDTLMFGWPQSPACGGTREPATTSKDTSPAARDWFERLGRRPAAVVRLVVPWSTAVGLTDAPCEVVGHGWVTADHARQMMLNDGATWQRLGVDAESGAARQLEPRAYRPTATMRAQVEAVDGTCRAPGCTVPAARCDLDHDIPWPHGPTEVTNLTSKHRHHHNVHTHGHWLVRREGDRVRWRTKAARIYDSYPKDWLEAVRDADPVSPPVVNTAGPRSSRDDPPPF
ncbi:HNH endonuclease signature motif containing protein [Terrabacter carboxydivorans]